MKVCTALEGLRESNICHNLDFSHECEMKLTLILQSYILALKLKELFGWQS